MLVIERANALQHGFLCSGSTLLEFFAATFCRPYCNLAIALLYYDERIRRKLLICN